MNLTIGLTAATAATRRRARRSIFRMMLSVMRIWMIMATGATIRTTDMFGSPRGFLPDGRHIARATGIGFLPGVGLGWMTLRGAMHLFTTDVG